MRLEMPKKSILNWWDETVNYRLNSVAQFYTHRQSLLVKAYYELWTFYD